MTLHSFKQRLEAALVAALYRFFGALPVDVASDFGGWLGRTIGFNTGLSRRAYRNLRRVFPDMPKAEQDRIVRGMWDNLGRVAAEFPHLHEFRFGAGERIEVEGQENIDLLRDDGQPGIFFGGHIGNWELNGFCAAQNGVPIHLIYRAANNPHLSWLFDRRASLGVHLVPKGSAGARLAIDALKNGAHLGLLMDQKMNDGIPVPFFGIPAMTAPALAQFALRFKCPVVPACVRRIDRCRFRLVVEKPLEIIDTGDRHADIMALMIQVNNSLERWIREAPEQWLWLHNRWPEEVPNRDPDAAE